MSYNCLISFKSISPIEVFPFLVQFKKNCTAHLCEIAKNEYAYCPFIKEHLTVPESFSEISIEDRKKAQSWASELFKFKYFYNVEFGMLGVFGVPNALTSMFDGTICFQNSTDQDYERKTYEGIQQFDEIFCKWAMMPDDQFRSEYEKRKGGESFDAFIEKWYPEISNNEMLIDKHKSYYKRSFCYEEIWSHFEKHLWNDEENIFFSVYGAYERHELMCFVKYCYDEQLEFQNRYAEEFSIKKNEQ